MKHVMWTVCAALCLSGCLAEVATTTAIQGTLQAQQLTAMDRQVKGIAESSGRTNLQRAIDTYKAEKGANPPNLEALAPGWIPAVPVHTDGTPYGYDPLSGTLYNSAAEAAQVVDNRTMQRIREAINAYGTAVGYYPPTLDALVPTYLPQSPRTAAGAEFLYNNQDGALSVPGGGFAAAGAAPRGGGGVPVAGGGPMGETVTAIGMSQQLDNMSTGGSAAAGSRMREQAHGISVNPNDKTNAAMDGLGL